VLYRDSGHQVVSGDGRRRAVECSIVETVHLTRCVSNPNTHFLHFTSDVQTATLSTQNSVVKETDTSVCAATLFPGHPLIQHENKLIACFCAAGGTTIILGHPVDGGW